MVEQDILKLLILLLIGDCILLYGISFMELLIKHSIRSTEKIPVQSFKNKYEKLSKYKSVIEVQDRKNVVIKFAHCCNPIPNDKIIAIVSENNTANIHKIDCAVYKTKKGKKAQATWKKNFESSIILEILADDRLGLLADLMKTFSNCGINVEKANASIVNKNMAEFKAFCGMDSH